MHGKRLRSTVVYRFLSWWQGHFERWKGISRPKELPPWTIFKKRSTWSLNSRSRWFWIWLWPAVSALSAPNVANFGVIDLYWTPWWLGYVRGRMLPLRRSGSAWRRFYRRSPSLKKWVKTGRPLSLPWSTRTESHSVFSSSSFISNKWQWFWIVSQYLSNAQLNRATDLQEVSYGAMLHRRNRLNAAYPRVILCRWMAQPYVNTAY